MCTNQQHAKFTYYEQCNYSKNTGNKISIAHIHVIVTFNWVSVQCNTHKLVKISFKLDSIQYTSIQVNCQVFTYKKKNNHVKSSSINFKRIFEHFRIKRKTQGGAVADSFGLMLCCFMQDRNWSGISARTSLAKAA